MTLVEYLAIWLDHARTRVRAKTFERCSGMIRLHIIPDLGDTELEALTPMAIQRHYGALQASG